ncbi:MULTISPECIES: hypothetical protein [Thiomicrorhabdus]|uniref:Uncharacterized protein n=1 Tax=Thiomicrorhabdus heinhorstiae TaxID=2748010 RepID=A0ABS0BV44_9GAMM|nr:MULTISPECIES: hypothetical protein [Thiomicrorhabdus]MBF6057693.1 hypothetical protein [Thiomicrorhabdus heinhorstiae]
MEIGSQAHKELLLKSIVKVAVKTASIGLFIGGLLLIPAIFRENDFSTGLAYAGSAIIFGSLGYSLWIAYGKYRRLIKPFKAHN